MLSKEIKNIVVKRKRKLSFIVLSSVLIQTVFISASGSVISTEPEINKIPVPPGYFSKAPGTITTNGAFGTIFQARNGDIYVMGNRTGLEVLKDSASKFVPAPGTKITNGRNGTIFQARNGNLYVMGFGTGLEFLKDGDSKFVPAQGTKITDGKNGTIFQAQNGDLYVMGAVSGLQVLKNGASKFVPVQGTKIRFGRKATIFQTKNGDLYVMGFGAGIEVLKNGASKFVPAQGTKITNGINGTIFQARNGDLYVMAARAGLEVLKNTVELSFSKTDETAMGKNDGSITITNGTDTYSKLQYKLESNDDWIDVPANGKITNLTPGTYQFQWVGKNGEQYVGGTSTNKPISITVIIVTEIKIAIPTTIPVFNKNDETAKGKNDGIITVADGTDTYSQLQYKLKNVDTWTDVPENGKITNLTPGTYQFRWKSKNDEQYINTNKTTINISKKAIVIKTKKIVSSNNQTIILATTIPIAFVVILAIILLIKYKPFKKILRKILRKISKTLL